MIDIQWSGATTTVQKHLNLTTFPLALQRSTITICIKALSAIGDVTVCEFKAALTALERTEFAQLVEDHDASIMLPEQTVALSSIVENHEIEQYDLTYKMRPFLFQVPAQAGLHSFPLSFPYPIMLLGGVIESDPTMIGDSVQFDAIAKTLCGYLAAPATSGNSSIHVDDEAAIKYLWKGYNVYALTFDQSGIVIVGATRLGGEIVGKIGSQILLSEPLTESFPAGTVIAVEFVPVEKLKLKNTNTIWISRDTERGANMPANTPMLFHYWNREDVAKEAEILLEYYV